MKGLPNFNHALFNEAAFALRDDGIDVLNPAENDGGSTDKPRSFYLRCDLQSLSRAEAIVMLPGWEGSTGARMELAIATELGLEVFRWDPEFPHSLVRITPINTDLAEQAAAIVSGCRQQMYGSPENNLRRIGEMWGAILDRSAIPPRKVAHMMSALKIIRDTTKPNPDNLIDLHGYTFLAGMFDES